MTPFSTGGSISGGPFNCADTTGCTETFNPTAQVSLSPVESAGYRFKSWSGACTGTAVPCTVTVDATKRVNATFEKLGVLVIETYSEASNSVNGPSLSIDADLADWPACSLNPRQVTANGRCGVTVPIGTVVHLTATTTAHDTSWTGCNTGTGGLNVKTCAVTIRDDPNSGPDYPVTRVYFSAYNLG